MQIGQLVKVEDCFGLMPIDYEGRIVSMGSQEFGVKPTHAGIGYHNKHRIKPVTSKRIFSNGFSLEMEVIGVTAEGRDKIGFRFFESEFEFFKGTDYYPSPMVHPTGDESASDLIKLLFSKNESDEPLKDSEKQFFRKHGSRLDYIEFEIQDELGMTER